MSSEQNGKVRRPHLTIAPKNDGRGWANDAIKRTPRRGQRSKCDLGLPPDAELVKLARVFLETQRRLWPKIVAAGLLNDPTDEVLSAMVADFKRRHREGSTEVGPLKVFLKYTEHLGGSYSRFSCDNSDPKSIIDQLVLELERAHLEDRFVPWEYVFCDYSITGFDSSRQGYTSYKRLLSSKEHLIETTYIDDFSRASREELEWWKLASISRKYQKRLIGASDNFTLHDSDWEIKIKLYALFSALNKISLQQKVRRGMRGAFREGGVVGKLILGHGRCPRRNENGEIIRRTSGKAKTTRCIDATGKKAKRLMYCLFIRKNWSLGRIARHFNKKKVDGWDRWSAKSIAYELGNSANLGIFIWNQFRQEYNWEEEKVERVENPRSQWEFYIDRSLALVPMSWWKLARHRLVRLRADHPNTGKTLSRNEKSATTLFSGTLLCEYCESNDEVENGMAEIKLYRSAKKYKQMACLNGAMGKCGCQLSSSKSTNIIESSLLGFIVDGLVTEDRLRDHVTNGNNHLKREARKPKVNIRPMQSRAKKLKAEIKQLFGRIKGNKSERLCKAYDEEIDTLQAESDEVEAKIRDARNRNAAPPPPLDLERVKDYLADIRGLLNQEVPAAAEAIRALTGRILIRQGPSRGRGRGKGATWTATFSPDFLRLLAKLGRERDYPDSVTLEYLCARNWIKPDEVECVIEDMPLHEQIAADVQELAQKHSRRTCASILGVNLETINNSIRVANGELPRQRPGKKRSVGPATTARVTFREIAGDVAHRHDVLEQSFEQIANELGCSPPMVRRAYDHAHPELIEEAVESGEPPRRAKNSRLGATKKARIAELILQGDRTCDIVRKIGCSRATVNRMRERLARKT